MSEIKYNCVFGGGGIRGLCYIGAVKALQEFGINIESIAGSSVGAVFAALYAVGYSAQEIKELFFDFNFNMFRDLNIGLFNNDISISKGEIFLDWMREKLEQKVFGTTDGTPVRFKDINRDLLIHALDINTNTPYIFSKLTTPDEEIAVAVRVSAGLPGLMKPINIGTATLVDGDLIKTRPSWKIYKNFNTSDKRILEFRLEGSRDGSDIKNPMDYLNSIISTIWYLSTEEIYNDYNDNDRYDFVIIDTKDIILFDFTIDKLTREKLIENGYKQTVQYFSKTIINKKRKILTIYEKIYKEIENLNKFIIQKKTNLAMSLINEILSEMYDNTKYIDISIYEKIKELKQYLFDNIKNDFVFCKIMNNHKQIKERSEFVLMLIEERIEDIKKYLKLYCNNC
ncbi:patatin-like phospholipase family protein [bacterium]|nr:patatin-like phospholipase family protein [bacterium]